MPVDRSFVAANHASTERMRSLAARLTDAQFLGFRLVRPLNIPSAAELQKVWTSGVEKE